MTTIAQQHTLDNALVAIENQCGIGKCNMRINPGMKPKEPTYHVVLDALALKTCYSAFLITANVPVIYMHQFWATINKHNASYRFKIDNKRFSMNVEVFRDILNICLKILGKADRGKGLNVLLEVALSEAAQLKEATKHSKNDFHMYHASGSGDGMDFESGFPDEQQCKISGTDEGTSTKPGVPDVPIYDFEKVEEEEIADERVHTPKNHELTNDEDNAKEENKEEKDDAEELYKDNASLDDNEIDSLMDTTVRHEEPSRQTSSFYTVSVTILPQAVLKFVTPLIEQNVKESLEAAILAKSSSYSKSTFSVAASLLEFELTKILLDKMEEHKSYLELIIKGSFMVHWSQDDKDKDHDPFAGSDRGMKRKKSSKEAESSRDPRLNEKEPSHTVDDSGVRKNQEFNIGNYDEQLDEEAAYKVDWFMKSKQPSTPDPDWNKRQHVDFRPPQTWISDIACAENHPT
uniref:Uncharacterized protein n=1 Tax=Tanacetum cinerariifolium TaxID=118510 RepID=A0A6L2L540_TANCI|nr:hypothetical protein [Tanacetum cinerariifolium]